MSELLFISPKRFDFGVHDGDILQPDDVEPIHHVGDAETVKLLDECLVFGLRISLCLKVLPGEWGRGILGQ